MVRHRVVAVAVVFASVLAAGAVDTGRARAETPIPPSPAKFVTDRAGFLSAGVVSQLSQRLEDYQRGTGHQLIVYIDRTTGGVPVDDWAVRAFRAWGVGRKQEKDGAALFVFSDDREMRIEVGYGLEDRLPDARAGRIIQNVIAPRIRDGDRDGAVKAGVDEMIAAIGGKPEPRAAGTSPLAVVFPIIFFIVVFMIARRHPWALLLLGGRGGGWGGRGGGGWGGGGWGGGGWGGGGFGGGGGFSGGGGSSGGGGASGGW